MPRLLQIMLFYMHHYFEYIVLQPWLFDWWNGKLFILFGSIVSIIFNGVANLLQILMAVVCLFPLLWQLFAEKQKRKNVASTNHRSDKLSNLQTRESQSPVLLDAFYNSSSSDQGSWFSGFSRIISVRNNYALFTL